MSRYSARRLSRENAMTARKCDGRWRLRLERLEQREVPAVNLVGLPTWVNQGSSPILNAPGVVAAPNNPAGGAVESVAVDPNNAAHIIVGTVNGGVWQTFNGNRPFNGIDDDGANGVDDAAE